jgi:hypothetical protein
MLLLVLLLLLGLLLPLLQVLQRLAGGLDCSRAGRRLL